MYYAVASFIIFLAALNWTAPQKRLLSLVSTVYVFLVLVIFASLRWEVGHDWPSYLYFFRTQDYYGELGYRWLNNAISSSGRSFSEFLLVVNFISLVGIATWLYRFSPLPIFGLLLFYSDLYLYLNFSGIRQSVAIGISLFSYAYLLKRRFDKFAITILLAASFHVSALALFILTVFFFRRFEKFTALGIIAIFFVTFLYFLPDMAALIDESLGINISYYALYQLSNENSQSGYVIGAIRRIIPIVLVVLFWRKLRGNQALQLNFSIYLVGVIIFILFYPVSADIGVRVSSYFILFESLLIPQLILEMRSRLWKTLIFILYIAICFYKVAGYSSQHSYIYSTIL